MSTAQKPQAGASPLYELIYDVLREHLADGSFPPGLVLGEAAVARAFQSSRIPAAAALKRLHAEGLIKNFEGRGYLARKGDPKRLVRTELVEAGLRLPQNVAGNLRVRNHQGRIYPDVEHAVAACLAYGRFIVNESALAEHYGVSRTVAHEVLTSLERTGLVVRDLNQRWYAGPLTLDRLREHFEMRWLLEPAALGQAMDTLTRDQVTTKRDRTLKARTPRQNAAKLEQLETDLHIDTVLACTNTQLRETIRLNLRPLIPTHSTFASGHHTEEIAMMFDEHLEIFEAILAKKKKQAMGALEAHLRRSLDTSIERLQGLGPLPDDMRRPFLTPAPQ